MKRLVVCGLVGTAFVGCMASKNVSQSSSEVEAFDIEKYATGAELTGQTPAVEIDYGVAAGADRESLWSMAKQFTDLLAAPLERGSTNQQVFADAAPSVVAIRTKASSGTGFIIAANGSVVTNWHVVGDYKVVSIMLYPDPSTGSPIGETFLADVLDTDPSRDLALLRIRSNGRDFPALEMASETATVGLDVHAIGHPVGQNWSYTAGLVSGVRPAYAWRGRHKATVIQTQTPINPGNSGGPLLSDEAKVLGVNSFTLPDFPGMNYAVAASEVDAFLAGAPPTFTPIPPLLKRAVVPIDDRNGDGKPDVWAEDYNGNGVQDGVLVDEDFDGDWDVHYGDSNEDLKTDWASWDKTDDQKPDYFEFDTNFDGKSDAKAFDKNGDGYPDRLMPL